MRVLIGYYFLLGRLYFIGIWLGEEQRTNTMKKHVQKKSDNFLEIN